MTENKYEIIGRCTEGTSVLGYVVKNNTEEKLIDKTEVERLALEKRISNVKAQIYDGKVILKGVNCRLSKLPNYDKHGSIIQTKDIEKDDGTEARITARVLKGKAVLGYIISVYNSKGDTVDSRAIQKDKVVELAKNGYISNARVQMFNGKAVLRGVNCDLAQLNIAKAT